MSAIKNGGPAFPQAKVTVLAEDGTPNEAASITHGGMTLRDYFAAKAMQGMLADPDTRLACPRGNEAEWELSFARSCYDFADAMLAARSAAVQPARPAPGADGWIEWKGGDCPVPADVEVEYRLRNGYERRCVAADLERWEDLCDAFDIVAYRVVGEVKP